MSAIVVQICRADDNDELQKQIGAAMQYWANAGFNKINVTFESNADARAGVYTMNSSKDAPKKLGVDQNTDQTAVLVLTEA
ncbi:MAG: hypothetical protein ABR588_07545 [Sphingomicrobium sp.]|nr:hypothetical protein [Sphingomonadales bacterium]